MKVTSYQSAVLGNGLTPRERQVLKLIVYGRSTKQTAAALGMAFKTAVTHRTRIMSKLYAHNTADLVRTALRMGLVDPGEWLEE
jgi:DNA-binding CsgD family transcriptional regulator